MLVRTRKPGDTPEAVDCPVQYHADDSASGAPTSALGAVDGPRGADVPRVPAMPTPATTTTTRASTSHRRSGL